MPDDYTLADVLEIDRLRREGFTFGRQYRTNRYNLQQAGLEWKDADRIASAYASFAGESSPLDSPLSLLVEVVSTFQKPVIALAGGIASGRPLTEIAGEVAMSPFTANRSFGEAGASGKTRKFLDVVADPSLVTGIGAAARVGTAGKAIKSLTDVAQELAMSNVTRTVTKEGGEKVVKEVTKLSELVKTPAAQLTRRGSAEDAKSLQDLAKKSYSEVSRAWSKSNAGVRKKAPEIDELTHASPDKLVPASDLIDLGASGLVTLGVGSKRMIPLKGLQAKVARGVEKGQGKIAKGAQRLLQLDSSMRAARAMRSGYVAREGLSGLSGEEMDALLKSASRSSGFDDVPRGTDLEDLYHVRESVGRLQEGGFGKAGKATRMARNLDEDPASAVRVMMTMAKAVNSKGGREAQEAALERLGFFTKPGSKDLIDLPVGDYDLSVAEGLANKVRDWRRAKKAADGVDVPDFDDFLQIRHVQDEIENMALHLFRISKDSKEWRFLQHLDDIFMKQGDAALRAGVLSRVNLGYIPRIRTPGFKAIHAALNKSGARPRWSAKEAAGRLSEEASFAKQRGWDNYTTREIEDMFRRGEVESVRGWTPERMAESYKTQVGITGWNKFWPRFTSLFGDRGTLDAISKADPELARVFFADPVVFATMNHAQWMRVLNARDYMNSATKLFSSHVIEKKVGENAGQFHARVSGEIADRLGSDSHGYRVIYRLGEGAEPSTLKAVADEAGGDVIDGMISMSKEGADALAKAAPEVTKSAKAYIVADDLAVEMFDYYRRVLNPPAMQSFIRYLPAFTKVWKAWALGVRPAYHFRNHISNKLQMMAMGMDPISIVAHDIKSMELMNAMRGSAKQFDTLKSDRARGLVEGLKQGKKVIKGGRNLDDVFVKGTVFGDLRGDEVLLHALNEGVLNIGFFPAEIAREVFERTTRGQLRSGAKGLRDRLTKGPFKASDNPFTRAGHYLGESVENWSRLSAFMWGLKQGKTPAQAAQDVTKFFFNYNDLKPWEKTLRSTAIPFYSWTRKNLPLQLRNLIEKPGLTSIPFKIAHSLREQSEVTRDLEPAWIASELGVPWRTVKGPDGREIQEFWHTGSFLPVSDLLRVGSTAMALVKGSARTMGLLPKEVQAAIAQRGDIDQGVKAAIQHLNPVIDQTLEKMTGLSLARLSKLKPEQGGLVTIPYLGGAVVSTETGSLLAMAPLLGELHRLFLAEDRFGIKRPLSERFQQVLTGSSGTPLIGGKYTADLEENRRRMLGRIQRSASGTRGRYRNRLRSGQATEKDLETMLEWVKVHNKRRTQVASQGQQ